MQLNFEEWPFKKHKKFSQECNMIQLLLDILLFIQERVTPDSVGKESLAIQETQYTQVPAPRSGRSHGGGNSPPSILA